MNTFGIHINDSRRVGFMELSGKQFLEYRANERLNEEHLREPCKGEIEADQLEPVRQQRDDIEPQIIGIIQPCRQKAHRRTHNPHCRRDDSRLKDHRMRRSRIKALASQLERKRTADGHFQQIGQTEFNQDDSPYGQHLPAKHHAALPVDRFDHTARLIGLHERLTVDNVETVKHVGMDGHDDRQQSKHRPLEFRLWHRKHSSFFICDRFSAQKNMWDEIRSDRAPYRHQIYVLAYHMCRASYAIAQALSHFFSCLSSDH